MRPIRDLVRMVTMPFTALFVVGLCWLINTMTSPHRMWWQWVALGMGIATVVALARGLRTLAVLVLAWWVGRSLLRRYGPQAQALFEQGLAGREPDWREIARAWRFPSGLSDRPSDAPMRH